MPDGVNTPDLIAQRMPGFPRGRVPRGRVPGGRFPGGRVPRGQFPRRRFPGVVPVRRFPRFFVPPVIIGFPPGRCYFVDRFGRCCDRYGRCCDRFGRCEYIGGYGAPILMSSAMDSWNGVPGGWDMMPDMYDMDDAEVMMDYDDMTDYDD